MRKNQTCVVQVSVPVAKGCLGRVRSRLVVGGCSEATGWGFESVPVPCDVPRQWTSSAGILTRISFAQSELEGRSGLPFTHRFELRVFIGE